MIDVTIDEYYVILWCVLMSDSRHAISLKRNFEGVKKFAAQKRHTALLKKRWIKRLEILIYPDTNYIQPKATRLFISLLTCYC